MRSFKEFQADTKNMREADIQAKHFDTQEYDVIPESKALAESISADPENLKRIIVGHDADADERPKGVSGLSRSEERRVGKEC